VIQSLPLKSTDELLQRIGAQPDGNVWTVLVVDGSDIEVLIEELSETISIFSECEVKVISAQNGVLDLFSQIKKTSEDYVLLWSFETWNSEDWYRLDSARSELTKKRGGILVLPSIFAKTMLNSAPNFCSWVGSRIYALARDSEFLTDPEREVRLSTLREWSGLSDAEVIASAECHQLPPMPEYGEWLVLLGRGDLIER
jgi:Asp-tRNA(Asn)/Glu-tRNA(Gln) amidotransferase C subunit